MKLILPTEHSIYRQPNNYIYIPVPCELGLPVPSSITRTQTSLTITPTKSLQHGGCCCEFMKMSGTYRRQWRHTHHPGCYVPINPPRPSSPNPMSPTVGDRRRDVAGHWYIDHVWHCSGHLYRTECVKPGWCTHNTDVYIIYHIYIHIGLLTQMYTVAMFTVVMSAGAFDLPGNFPPQAERGGRYRRWLDIHDSGSPSQFDSLWSSQRRVYILGRTDVLRTVDTCRGSHGDGGDDQGAVITLILHMVTCFWCGQWRQDSDVRSYRSCLGRYSAQFVWQWYIRYYILYYLDVCQVVTNTAGLCTCIHYTVSVTLILIIITRTLLSSYIIRAYTNFNWFRLI